MLFNIQDLPANIKLFKTLTADKIKLVSKPVINFKSEELKLTCWRMIKVCTTEGGVGYAAPQMNVYKRMFIIKESDTQFRLYVNPSYKPSTNSKLVVGIEGCLSLPKQWISVYRPDSIEATWTDIETEKTITETLTDYKSRVFSHEHDHLLGLSILDRYKEHKEREKK